MKKYGLILTGKHAKAAAPNAPRSAKPVMAAFGGDDSDDEDELKARLESERSRQYQQSAQVIASAAPELADYDSFLEQKQAAEAAAREKAKAARKESKYIGALKRNAERRSFQLEQMRERQIQRQQEAEKDEFGETERFVTSAYKAKLAADKARAEEEARLEAEEKARAKAGMAGFYANLGRAQGLGGKHNGATLPPSSAPSAASVASSKQPSSSTSATRASAAGEAAPRYTSGQDVARGASVSPPPARQDQDDGGGFDDFDDFEGGEVLMPGQTISVGPPSDTNRTAADARGRSRSRSPPPRSAPQVDTPAPAAAPSTRAPPTVDSDAIAAAKARALARAAQRKAAAST